MTVPAAAPGERLLGRLAQAERGAGLWSLLAEMGKLRAPAAVHSEVMAAALLSSGAGKLSWGLQGRLQGFFYLWNSCCLRIWEYPLCTNWTWNTFKTLVFNEHPGRGISQGKASAKAGFQVESVGSGEGVEGGTSTSLHGLRVQDGVLRAQGELSPHTPNPEKADRHCSVFRAFLPTCSFLQQAFTITYSCARHCAWPQGHRSNM